MTDKLALWIAQLGPIGRIKYGPGTFGSLAAIPLLFVAGDGQFLPFLCLAVITVGVWASGRAAQAMKVKDPSTVIIDEVCGMLVTFLFVPINLTFVIIGFVCFRFFDIVKPPPIRLLEKAPGGIGIVLDDIGAGIFANLILQIIHYYA